MYVRFETSRWDIYSRAHYGFFGPAYACAGSPHVEAWQRDALWDEIGWFNTHLDVPRVLSIPTGHRNWRSGVCWFRDTAVEHISRARFVVWLLGENGVDIVERRSQRPGTQIWRDDHQVVALSG